MKSTRHPVRGPIALTLGTMGLVFFAAPPAMAATSTANLGVSATVTANCNITTSPVAFGSVNTVGGSATDASGGVTVNCTSGTAWAASAGVGNGSGATYAARQMVAGSDLLAYTLFTDTGRTSIWGDGTGVTATITGTGNGSAQNATIFGRVAAGQTSVPVGSYADTVAVTITY